MFIKDKFLISNYLVHFVLKKNDQKKRKKNKAQNRFIIQKQKIAQKILVQRPI